MHYRNSSGYDGKQTHPREIYPLRCHKKITLPSCLQTSLAFTEEHAATSFTHGRTSLVVSHTSNSLQWHPHIVREHLARSHNRPLSPSQKNTQLLASHAEEPALWSVTWATRYSDTHTHTLPTNSKTNILTGDTKRDTFSLLLFYDGKQTQPREIYPLRCHKKKNNITKLFTEMLPVTAVHGNENQVTSRNKNC